MNAVSRSKSLLPLRKGRNEERKREREREKEREEKAHRRRRTPQRGEQSVQIVSVDCNATHTFSVLGESESVKEAVSLPSHCIDVSLPLAQK